MKPENPTVTTDSSFPARAAREIDDLHRLLQAWFRAEGGADAEAVLARFDEAFTMITPGGALIGFAQFSSGFPALRGTRPGLVMEISDVAVRHAGDGAALVTYREHQRQGDNTTDRRSTALLLDRPDRAAPVWRHLQETFLQPPQSPA